MLITVVSCTAHDSLSDEKTTTEYLFEPDAAVEYVKRNKYTVMDSYTGCHTIERTEDLRTEDEVFCPEHGGKIVVGPTLSRLCDGLAKKIRHILGCQKSRVYLDAKLYEEELLEKSLPMETGVEKLYNKLSRTERRIYNARAHEILQKVFSEEFSADRVAKEKRKTFYRLRDAERKLETCVMEVEDAKKKLALAQAASEGSIDDDFKVIAYNA